MFCTKCGAALAEGAVVCSQCNAPVVGASTQDSTNSPQYSAPKPIPQQSPSDFQKFINFDIMITPAIMKVIYIIGSVVIIIAALVSLFSGQALVAIAAIFGGAAALVFFRLYCELVMVFFKMHENLKHIKNNTERN